jgi:hypothetical protein
MPGAGDDCALKFSFTERAAFVGAYTIDSTELTGNIGNCNGLPANLEFVDFASRDIILPCRANKSHVSPLVLAARPSGRVRTRLLPRLDACCRAIPRRQTKAHRVRLAQTRGIISLFEVQNHAAITWVWPTGLSRRFRPACRRTSKNCRPRNSVLRRRSNSARAIQPWQLSECYHPRYMPTRVR